MTTPIDKDIVVYIAALNQALQTSVEAAADAYDQLISTRTNLGLAVEDADGVTPELKNQAEQVAGASKLLDAVTAGVVSGARKLGYSVADQDFAIEAVAGDVYRLVRAPTTLGFSLVPIGGGEGTIQGPPILWAGVAVAVVQAAALYLVVAEAADAVKSVARQNTERTIAKTASQYAKLVDEGKATPAEAKALTESLYLSSVELAKATPPPPPPGTDTSPGGTIKEATSAAKTIAWIALGGVVVYGTFKLVTVYAARREASTALELAQ